jgi:methionyl-tRNA formyltransferase
MNQLPNLVFCGTPKFAVPTLQKLVDAGFPVRLVLTQPDRPRGRGLQLAPSPVKECAVRMEIPVLQPDKIKNNQELRAKLESLRPEAIIVVGYGRIIPQWMIDLPPLGNLNLHASLLPKYRGAAPIQWAIANGETATGVTTMRIDAGLDTGDILLQTQMPIAITDTSESLASRLADLGAELMVETLIGLRSGTVQPRRQDDSQATVAPILKKEDGLINFGRTAEEIYDRLRGFQPWPGAYASFRGKQLQIRNAKPGEPERKLSPGELLLEQNRLTVGCGSGTALQLLEVQPEGKKRISALDFANGYRLVAGDRLG